MSPKLLLIILSGTKSNRLGHQAAHKEAGFSILAVIFVVLALILGTLAVANRNSLGSLGSAYQSQGRVARAAAEIGMAELVSELNRPRNRPLLVNAESLSLRTVSAIETAPPGTFDTQVTGGGTAIRPVLSQTFGSGLITSQVINVGDGSQQRWQATEITTSNPTFNSRRAGVTSSSFGTLNTDFSVSVGAGDGSGGFAPTPRTGDITFTVAGYAYQAGSKVATSTLTKTFEVVPKCQGRSLNGYNSIWGNDTRDCELSLGLLFLAGAANNGSGSFDVTGGGSLKISITPTCLTPTGICSPFDLAYNPLDYTPPAVNQARPALTPTLQSVVNKCRRSSTGTDAYLGNTTCNFSNSTKYTDATALSTSNFASWPLELRNVCAQETVGGILLTVCSFNTLNNKNNLVFNTNGGPIRLYFPNPDANTSTPAFNNNSGNNSVRQINTSTNAPVAGDFALFGCDITQCPEMPFTTGGQKYAQRFDINVGNGSFGPGFTYFPFGLLEAGGSGGFSGVAWQNGFATQGSTTLGGTQQDLNSVGRLMGISGKLGETATPPLIDYVLRSVQNIRFF